MTAPALSHNARKVIPFTDLIRQVEKTHGAKVAARWTQAVLGHQRALNPAALQRAITSKNAARIAAALDPAGLQRTVAAAIRPPLAAAAVESGMGGTRVLMANGFAARFDATHPDVIHFARTQAGDLVQDIPKATRRIVAEVIARGAERGLTVEQQARAIREVVGLPSAWADAPGKLADDIRHGREAAATSRRISAASKQEIRNRIRNNTVTEAFVAEKSKEYAASLVNARAIRIARTETARAAHHGLNEGWKQAHAQGALPKSTRRFWIVTPDEKLSPEHARIPGMNPKGRKLDEPFVTTEGLHMYPPSRPHCRCAVALSFGGTGPRDAERAARVEIAARARATPAVPRRKVAKTPAKKAGAPALPTSGAPLVGDKAREHVLSRMPDELTAAEKSAFKKYTGTAHEDLNRSLRTQVPLSPHSQQVHAELTQTLARTKPLQQDIRVWRAGAAPNEVFRTPRGVRFQDRGWASATAQRDVAAGFAKKMDEYDFDTPAGMQNAIFKIRVPKGSRVLGVPRGGQAYAGTFEAEVMLPPGGTFTTTGRQLVGSRWEVEMDWTPPGRAVARKKAVKKAVDAPTPGGVRVAKGTQVTAREMEAVSETLTSMGIDPKVVQFDAALLESASVGQGAGTFRGTVVGEYRRGQIRLAPGQSSRQLKNVAAHEAQHLKFDTVWQEAPLSFRKLLLDNQAAFAADDGVTAYSRAHWRAAIQEMSKPGGSPLAFKTALDETLAEIRGLQAAGRTAGSPRYRALLDSVDAMYDTAQAAASQRAGGLAPSGVRRKVVKKKMARPTRAQMLKEEAAAKKKALKEDKFAQHKVGADATKATTRINLTAEQRRALDEYVDDSKPINGMLREHAKKGQKGLPAPPPAPGPRPMRADFPTEAQYFDAIDAWDDTKKAYSDALDEYAHIVNTQRLDSIFADKSSALQDDVIVWRGLSGKWVPKKGTVFSDTSFTSSSFDLNTAEEFGKAGTDGSQHIFRIGLPKGTRGIYMPAHSQANLASQEYELLLARGTKFRITRKRMFDQSGRTSIRTGASRGRMSQTAYEKEFEKALMRNNGGVSRFFHKVYVYDVEVVL